MVQRGEEGEGEFAEHVQADRQHNGCTVGIGVAGGGGVEADAKLNEQS